MLRNEILSLSVTRVDGAFGLHVVAMDDHGVPRHQELAASDRHGIGLLLARAVKRWLENRWSA